MTKIFGGLFFLVFLNVAAAKALFFEKLDASLFKDEIVQYNFSYQESPDLNQAGQGTLYLKKTGEFLLQTTLETKTNYTLKYESGAFFELIKENEKSRYHIYTNTEQLPLGIIAAPLMGLSGGVVNSLMGFNKLYNVKITLDEVTLHAKEDKQLLRFLSLKNQNSKTLITIHLNLLDGMRNQHFEVLAERAPPSSENLALKFILEVPQDALVARIN